MLEKGRDRSPNQVLGGMSISAYRRMLPQLEQIELMYGEVIYEPGDIIKHVHFPLDSLVSLLTAVDGDKSTEVGMVGREGMLGVPVALGVSISAMRALVQGSGTALRMTVAHFRRHLQAEPALQRALMRYTHGLMSQFAQTAACNRFHSTDARLARWLLMTADRMGNNQFYLTQEFLAQMLGVRRVGVTQAARAMQSRRLIIYSRGNISIRDRGGLESEACACYGIVNELQDFTAGLA